jgi:hypothetical protein
LIFLGVFFWSGSFGLCKIEIILYNNKMK